MNNQEIILRARPKSKETSIKVYSGIMNKLNKIMEEWNPSEETHSPYKWIENHDTVEVMINSLGMKPSTQRNYWVVCMIICEGINGGTTSGKWYGLPEYSFYSDKVVSLNTQLFNEKKTAGGISESQANNIATREDIVKMVGDIYRQHVYHIGKRAQTTTQLTEREIKLMNAWMLIHIYIEIPCRNELSNVQIIRKIDYNKEKPQVKRKTNYLVIDSRNMVLIRNKYKTANSKYTGGEKVTEISKDLKKHFNVYLKIMRLTYADLNNGPTPLFLYLNSMADPSNMLTKLLTATSQEFLNGKSISSTLLAKIKLTDPQISAAVAILQVAAQQRGTDIGTLANNYVGQPAPNGPEPEPEIPLETQSFEQQLQDANIEIDKLRKIVSEL